MSDPSEYPSSRRVELRLRGVVQGVGFRPFVHNEAVRLGLRGFVVNEADAVRIEAQGAPGAIDALLDALAHRLPPQARIDAMDVRERPCHRPPEGGFEIRRSVEGAAPRPSVPADLATCGACIEEIFSPGARRYRYPFTNCTNCGPRWSIIRGLPYDRPKTSMALFAMCNDCRAEYENPADRRFHAQPIACPVCGPRLRLLDASGVEVVAGDAALRRAAEVIRAGRIVAMKGLGGFQLLVDATQPGAVERLRLRKRRPDRPFAVLVSSLDAARRHCHVSEAEARLLGSPQAPIVLLRRRADLDAAAPRGAGGIAVARETTDGDVIADAVAPGNPYLGVMLPYTPLHHLLCREVGRPMVCTSGNLSEEPMATATAEAIERLGAIADVFLTHNRPIVRPVDDSVARVDGVDVQVLRRARGYAPRPLDIAVPSSPTAPAANEGSGRPGAILALGGHLKNAVALGLPREASDKSLRGEWSPAESSPVARSGSARAHRSMHVVLSAHVGDLDNVRSVEVFRRAIDDLLNFFQVAPEKIVCDLHPDYASTREAEAMAASLGVSLRRVQHHHAHVAACMAEHALAGPVLGFAWDGTGYGPDGTVWGGEALVCERSRFWRAAHLRTFPLPGGDHATREPRRSALGVLYELFGHDAARWAGRWFAPEELRALLVALERRVNCPRTSSMGRLFDAVAALAGLAPRISFEGQAAMALEFAVDPAERSAYDLLVAEPASPAGPSDTKPRGGEAAERPAPAHVVDWEPMLHAVLRDVERGEPAARVAARFHNALAVTAAEITRRVGLADVALSGGCFQNAVLTDAVRRQLRSSGFRVHAHRRVPPGDGCIALGQVCVAAAE